MAISTLLFAGALGSEAQAQAFPAVINLGSLSGTNGFRLDGVGQDDHAGNSVSAAGDINGDGITDLIVGADSGVGNGEPAAGSSYVVFGRRAGYATPMALSSLNGSNGFRLEGVGQVDHSGASVSAAGDINGDGFADLVIGAPFANPNGIGDAGSTYVVFGHSGVFAASLSLGNLNGSDGFRLDGTAIRDYSGRAVSKAGDINGDGIVDLLIGAPGADPNGIDKAGSSYVIFGHRGEFATPIVLSDLSGSDGFRMDGASAGDNAGASVSAAGDVNGDGIADIIVGAPDARSLESSLAGIGYVVFGRRSSFSTPMALSGLNGADGFQIVGEPQQGRAGASVSNAGDVNQDGIDDLIVGAPRARRAGELIGAGSSYVVFGRSSGFGAAFALNDLTGSNGFRLDGTALNDNTGSSVSGTGDLNGDGIADLIVGAPNADSNGNGLAGSSYVVFGRSGGFATPIALSNLAGNDGFRLDGAASGDRSGTSVSGAGDVNGDGIADLIIGAPLADVIASGDNRGSAYVVFGRDASRFSDGFEQ